MDVWQLWGLQALYTLGTFLKAGAVRRSSQVVEDFALGSCQRLMPQDLGM